MGAWWLRGGWRVGGWVAWRAHFFYLLLAGLTLGSWELGSLFAQGVVIAGRFGNPYRGMLSGSRCRGKLAGSRAHSSHKASSSPAASAACIVGCCLGAGVVVCWLGAGLTLRTRRRHRRPLRQPVSRLAAGPVARSQTRRQASGHGRATCSTLWRRTRSSYPRRNRWRGSDGA